jgi:NAD(P)-dependent dehydrogenase (short-subunit alcohol dehydrogenase family)
MRYSVAASMFLCAMPASKTTGVLDRAHSSLRFCSNSSTLLCSQTSVIGGMFARQEEWENIMKVNVFAPVNVAELLLPCVAKSKLKRIIMISSIMGSIAHVSDAKSPNAIAYSRRRPLPPNLTSHSYRSSKAALNMAMRSMALQLQVTCHTATASDNITHTSSAAPRHHVCQRPSR